MNVPSTVETALDDRPVEGANCLEAGAGVGNATAGLLAEGASRVCAVTNDDEDARTVRDRIGKPAVDRLAPIVADLRDLPLSGGSVDVVTAHGLFNVLPPADVGSVAAELSRVAAPGAHLIVDDYEPLPERAGVSDLFAVENAAAQLAEGRPALSFYPPRVLRRLFEGFGWQFDRERTLLEPVPWTEDHVRAHADVTRESAESLPERLRQPLLREVDRIARKVETERTGRMYSLAFRLSPSS